ncbi:phosphate/phosphite/phosphonate ABC transporter substrate-binding protein [Sphingopyxis sp. RIFCSPHIGHO2_12_FULL_65_19]|uniref:phosphate/phosphite/phosphonate ABC transporter substrate-binding protein n=1 Tax=Sphingopyxis sp. RIFCSPHIGHO2_12_FULL_65_19 TaxID=1802172 RepID=UPI0008BA9FD7|nr:PhnD/SsuA/transferrin family substrate-binding protein [Sphingopyxis sp. RIFCSPHIGHO2_12_FULL_65_19]OHD09255.1 MAG: hypothetical protein A3E77_03415 [Sphingopyxis sp. RIFCSPHIGHO2_12_FULL_65_19]
MILSFLPALSALFFQPAADAPLVVASYLYPGVDRHAALVPLADRVARAAKRPVRIELFGNPDALSQAVCDGRVDVAMTNLGAYVTMRDCPAVAAVAVLDVPPAMLEKYRGVLLTRADTGIAGLGDLVAKAAEIRYSEVLPGSTSGALVQAAELRTLGLSPGRFAETRHSGTHDAALQDLLTGRADLAASAEQPWHRMQMAQPGRAATLRLLWRSAPLPPGPVVCRAAAAVPCAAIRDALLADDAADAARALSGGWIETRGSEKFRAYDEATYAPFKRDTD